ncbi:MAG: FAD-dependent oxidoreductase [Melioribacteraceae bacterium]|nr:FAD-dependent oxidoreductase [Melioribacteraceae bacterium]
MRIIVVGGNAAGPAAAAKAKRVNPDAEIIIYEAGSFISSGTCEMPYLLNRTIDDYKKIVFFTPESFFEKKGVDVKINHQVAKINRSNKTVTVVNRNTNETYTDRYDRLILTTGSRTKYPPFYKDEIKNLFTLKTVSDYLKIENYGLDSIKNIVIIGSGYIGLECADVLKSINKNVTIIEKECDPFPSADVEIRKLILDSIKSKDIEFIGSAGNLKFIESDGLFKAVKVHGRIIETDAVIVSIGFEPNNSLAVGAGIKIGKFGGIIVDKRLRTSDQFIYAAGDNVEVENFITRKPDYMPIATIAHQQGHIAGANAAGENNHFGSVVKNISVKLFDSIYVQVGLNSSEASTIFPGSISISTVSNNLIHVIPQSRKIFGKLIFDKNSKRIFGASFLGDKEVVGYGDMISAFIKNKLLIDNLSGIDFSYTPPAAPFINILSLLERKAKEIS